MDDAITRQLESDLAALRAQLEQSDIFKDIQALERVIRLRRGDVRGAHNVEAPTFNDRHTPVGRQEAATSSVMKDAAEALLRGKVGPMQTKELFDALVAQGVHVPGDNPQNNLSAHLSRDGRFLSLGREGWVLVASVQPDLVKVKGVASEFMGGLSVEKVSELVQRFERSSDVPVDVDRELLAAARAALGRNLVEEEKRALRSAFVTNIQLHDIL